MVSYLIFPTSYSKAKNQSYSKLSSPIKAKDETSNVLQNFFKTRKTPTEEMTPGQLK